MQAGTHPDYYTLEPEKGKNTLGIDAVREVSEKLYEYARLGGAKVVWLKDAALLTEAAANALLKPGRAAREHRFSSPAASRNACWRRCAVAAVFTTSLSLRNPVARPA